MPLLAFLYLYELTLLSLSSSFFSHSKSLYLLRTQESFNLKMGRLVCLQKTHNICKLSLASKTVFFSFLKLDYVSQNDMLALLILSNSPLDFLGKVSNSINKQIITDLLLENKISQYTVGFLFIEYCKPMFSCW